ncbi:MAG: WYL domain-containing protein [Phycisphaerales bacterium]
MSDPGEHEKPDPVVPNPLVERLIDQARRRCLAVIYYRKGVRGSGLEPRMIEPYSFVDGRQDLMIRAYQIEPVEKTGWRFFMAHKIQDVEPTSIPFRPRRKISLPEATISAAFAPNHDWTEGRKVYRDLVGDALADGELSPDEVFDITDVKQRFALRDQDIRYVHASIYQRCLGSVLDDGFIDADEVEQIRFLHRAMRALGWCVGD